MMEGWLEDGRIVSRGLPGGLRGHLIRRASEHRTTYKEKEGCVLAMLHNPEDYRKLRQVDERLK